MNALSSGQPFYAFVREERQFSFLLAYLLMRKGPGLERFLRLVESRAPETVRFEELGLHALEGAEVYVEFAYLRDFWDSLLSSHRVDGRLPRDGRAKANSAKREFILSCLRQIPSLAELATTAVPQQPESFNRFFMGDAGRRIVSDIASPGLWSVQSLFDRFGSQPDVFLDLCKLKWSFHIKPDLVIAVPGLAPLCIEAKLESTEGTYPTGSEAALFNKAFGYPHRVKQFELQQFMFEKLLGEPCTPVVIQKTYPKAGPGSPITLIWGETLATIVDDEVRAGSVPFVSKLLAENTSLLTSYEQHRLFGGG